MWRYTRSILALLCLAGFSLLFIDVSGLVAPHLAFLGKVQLVPAFLSGSLTILILVLALTLLLGRIYCSILCPLGLLQDAVSRCRGRRKFSYSPGNTRLRVAVLVLFVVSLLGGIPLIFGILDPYSAFGRIATTIAAPVWGMGNNTLAIAAARLDSFAIAPVPVWQKGFSALLGAVITLGIISILAWRHGRTWCNTLCPVGTVLGLVGRFALVRPRISEKKCTHCGMCAAVCKASCIDTAKGRVDASRCVACYNCQNVCRHDALSFSPMGTQPSPQKEQVVSAAMPANVAPQPVAAPKASPSPSRRAMLVGLAASLAAMPAHAASRIKDAVIPAHTRKQRPSRALPIIPPGAISLANFSTKCTGCQLCVSACTHQALRAQDEGVGMLQPTLSFEHGFCRVNCIDCSSVCPTGAIRPITVAEKSATQVGRVVIHPELCIVQKDKVTCTACVRICPPRAITLVGEGEHKMPAVDNERCTGCGACEYICPARPYAAIRVEGNRNHRRI